MPEFALEMREISKTYGAAVRANDRINLAVEKGTIHALAGENGAGKSTLMKILFGLEEPDASSVTHIKINGKVVRFKSPHDAIASGIGMVQQHFALAGALSALDNIILGAELTKNGLVDRPQAEAVLKKIAGTHLALPWYQETDDLTVGLQQRIEILKLLFRNAQILILDEPTAVLTPQEVETFFSLLRQLKSEGRTILLITHKLNEVLSLCDNVTVLRQGQVTGQFLTQGLKAQDLVKAMIGREIAPLKRSAHAKGEALVELENIEVKSLYSHGLKGLSLKINKNEILGIAGVEGNGQKDLIEALLGLVKYQGTMRFKKDLMGAGAKRRREELNFGVISEDRHHQSLWLDASVSENAAIGLTKKLAKFGFLSSRILKEFAQKILAPYNVKMHSVGQKISSLSGGNQQKVVIAREISARQPEFLVASHPTRGVDVGAIEFIHQQILNLQQQGAGICLVSSELEELCALSDRIIVMFEGRGVKEFIGPNYDIEALGQAMTGGSA